MERALRGLQSRKAAVAGREISRSRERNCIFARDDRSIYRAIGEISRARARVHAAFPRANKLARTDASCATRVAVRDELAGWLTVVARSLARSPSVHFARRDENYGSLDRIDLEELAADFYASRREFHRRTALFASQGCPDRGRVHRLLFFIVRWISFLRHDIENYFKMM